MEHTFSSFFSERLIVFGMAGMVASRYLYVYTGILYVKILSFREDLNRIENECLSSTSSLPIKIIPYKKLIVIVALCGGSVWASVSLWRITIRHYQYIIQFQSMHSAIDHEKRRIETRSLTANKKANWTRIVRGLLNFKECFFL